MRLIALFFITTFLVFGTEFPTTFNSAGDEVYENMQKYLKIIDLDIYNDKPEFLEPFCVDANASMQKGFALDASKRDPEAKIDKGMIKSYAKQLRRLSNQNEAIYTQLQHDIQTLYADGDLQSLDRIREAGFSLSTKMLRSIAEDKRRRELLHSEQKKAEADKPKVKNEVKAEISEETVLPASKELEAEKSVVPAASTAEHKKAEAVHEADAREKQDIAVSAKHIYPVQLPVAENRSSEEAVAELEKPVKKLTEIEYYRQSLVQLKDELYTLRENKEIEGLGPDVNASVQEETKTACLNDVTAMNYWMIKVLENEKDACVLSDAIRQMKSYDKSAERSCGRVSMRYIEWHGRIKPYVGKRLFEAEALCHH